MVAVFMSTIFELCTEWPKKTPYFVFHPKVVFYNFFPYFSGDVDSRSKRFFWHQYGSNWTIYYAAADKNHRCVLCHKLSSSNTVAMQEKFWQGQYTWQMDNSTFGGQVSGDRKCSRCPQNPQRSTSFKSFKSNKPGSFSILWLISSQNDFSFCFILISLPLQDLNFERKELKVIIEDPQNWCSQNASFFWKTACWFSVEILIALP